MNILNIVKQANTKEKSYYTKDNFILGKDETLNPKFTKIFGLNYNVNVYYLKISKPELNLEKNSINIHLPMKYRKQNNQHLLNAILLKMYTKIAENELENIMGKARHTFGFAPEDYEIRKLNDTLATTSKEFQKIIINPYITMYSKEVIEYIVFHEFCHLKYKNHTKQFYAMLRKFKPNFETIAKQIPNFKY